MIAHEDDVTTASPSQWPLPLREHPQLYVDTEFAELEVVPIAPGEEPFIALVGDRIEGFCVDVKASGGITRVQIGQSWGFDDSWHIGKWWDATFWEKLWKKNFRARLVVHVPPSVRARLRSAAARVHVERLSGCELSIEADAGALSLNDVSGRLRLETQAGRIDGSALRGSFDVATSAGAIQLDILDLDPGTHRVRASMGAVRVELARGIPLQIHARTTMGSSRIDYPSVSGAPAVLDVEADLGAIRIGPSSHEVMPQPAGPEAVHVYGGPYRGSAAPVAPVTSDAVAQPADEGDVERILQSVAEGSLTPNDARELLRALGWP